LACMPESAAFAEGKLNRPLLTIDRVNIEVYAKKHQLKWVEDDSNQDLQFDRNYLRQRVVPRIKERWPAQTKVLSRVANIQADNALLLRQLAALDMQQGVGKSRETLSITSLKRLPLERQRNLIRFWIEENGFVAPGYTKLEHIISDVLYCKPDRTPVVIWGKQEVRRSGDHLVVMATLAKHNAAQQYQWDYRKPLLLESLSCQLQAQPTKSDGIVLPDNTKCLSVCFRSGGERIQPQAAGRQRTLKNLMQEAGIASWQRDRIPLVYLNDELIAVVGYWVSSHYVCPAGQSGLLFELTDC
ncbi:MAG: tRNA lysidine(34) synthetase TilS, partial [Gammaproteobacteria bacterium]|nr:tRNA lysidine(34) synthetase TilS [Gammaproteobacteria bacterium]